MVDVVRIPPGEDVVEIDTTERSMNWPRYVHLAKLGYTESEAKRIMQRVNAGILNLAGVPRKKRR